MKWVSLTVFIWIVWHHVSKWTTFHLRCVCVCAFVGKICKSKKKNFEIIYNSWLVKFTFSWSSDEIRSDLNSNQNILALAQWLLCHQQIFQFLISMSLLPFLRLLCYGSNVKWQRSFLLLGGKYILHGTIPLRVVLKSDIKLRIIKKATVLSAERTKSRTTQLVE